MRGLGYDNMDDVKWDSLVIEVNDYLQADESLDGALKQVVQLHQQRNKIIRSGQSLTEVSDNRRDGRMLQ